MSAHVGVKNILEYIAVLTRYLSQTSRSSLMVVRSTTVSSAVVSTEKAPRPSPLDTRYTYDLWPDSSPGHTINWSIDQSVNELQLQSIKLYI